MRILRSQDYRRMRWKNGGGETTEIIVSPDGAALDDFDWRVSMAHVASNGPFSLFPDIDRTLAVLSGNGIRLQVDGIGDVNLTTTVEPFPFPADVAAGADLINGPIHDLNVMSQRGVVQHTLSRMTVTIPIPITPTGDAMLLLIQGGAATIETGTSQVLMSEGDSVLLTASDAETILTPVTTLTLYKAEFHRVQNR